MLNRTSNGSVVIELLVSIALIIGVGATAHAVQHADSKTQSANQAMLSN